MTDISRPGWKRWVLRLTLAILILIVPPFLVSAGLVTLVVIQDYNGICPGIMDIPAYECSVWEFAARNSISPFALPLHLLIFMAYFAIAFPGITAVLIWKWFNEKQPSAS
ncbi:MAG TPA: hypothetical protein DEA96_04410 [Leptospiraceae bacterium]|nr:hypothetical protein [Spirochaetaceae bacterium]HBS04185.1 hypothetical protein [Leptospiraceae bacterium]|tara:strand:- start:23985 stop:24314 length:330 start_codon:yes stop_codon:yes gene_type:complete